MKIVKIVSIITASILVITLIVLSILGTKERVGYISEFNLDANLTTDTEYIYHARIKYSDKVFRNNDIYGVYPKTDNLPEHIKLVKWEEAGSPFSYFSSAKELSVGDKIDNVGYTLKVKSNIFIICIAVSIILLLILFKSMIIKIANKLNISSLEIKINISRALFIFIIILIVLGRVERLAYITVIEKSESDFKQSSWTDENFINGVNKNYNLIVFNNNYETSKILNKARFLRANNETLLIDKVRFYNVPHVYIKETNDLKNFEYSNKIDILDGNKNLLNSDDNRVYRIKMNYHSKIFRNSYIYRVYPDLKNLNNEKFKYIDFDSNESHFGYFLSNEDFSVGENLGVIYYKVKLKPLILIICLILFSSFFIIEFFNISKKIILKIRDICIKINENECVIFFKYRYIFIFILIFIFFIFFRPAYDLKEIKVTDHPEITGIYFSFTSAKNKVWHVPAENNFKFKKGSYVPRWYTKIIPNVIDNFYVMITDIKDFDINNIPQLKISSSKKSTFSKGVIEREYIVYKKWNKTYLYKYFYLPWNIFQFIVAFSITFILYKLRKIPYLLVLNYKKILLSPDGIVILFVALFYTFINILYWNIPHGLDLFQENIVYILTSDSHFFEQLFFTSRRISNVINAVLWCVFRDYGWQVFLHLAFLLSFIIICNMIMKRSKVHVAVRCIFILVVAFVSDIYNLTAIPHSNNLIPFIFLMPPLCAFAYFSLDKETKYWKSKWIIAAFIFSVLSFYTRIDGIAFIASVFFPALLFIKRELKNTFVYGTIFLLFMVFYLLVPNNDKWREQMSLSPFTYYMFYKSDKIKKDDKEYLGSVSEMYFLVNINDEALKRRGDKISENDFIKLQKGLIKNYPLEYLKFRIKYLFFNNKLPTERISLDEGLIQNNIEVQYYHVPFNNGFKEVKIFFSNSKSFINESIIKIVKSIHLIEPSYFMHCLFFLIILFFVLLYLFPQSTLISIGILAHIAALGLTVPTLLSFYYADNFFWILAAPFLFYCEYVRKKEHRVK